MPVKISVDSKRHGIIVTCTGLVTGQDIIETNAKIYADTQAVYQLWDFINAERVEISVQEMHAIAIQDNSIPLNSKLRCIAIVGEVKGLKEAYKQYEYLSSSWVGRRTEFLSEYFTNTDDAMAWISENIGQTHAKKNGAG